VTPSMDTAKIVILGPIGAGKTTAIRSITDGDPVSTEMPMLDGASGAKTTTTVALDFSSVELDDGTPLLVYGVPGQEHYSFMWPLILTGALGAIVLLDARDAGIEGTCDAWLARVAEHAPDAMLVVGVTHTDIASAFTLAGLRRVVKRFHRAVPVFTLDARDRAQIHQLMRALVVSAD
jgi:uncharacterized protein